MTIERQVHVVAMRLRKKYRRGELSPSEIHGLKRINFDFELLNSSDENKNRIREIALGGGPRPSNKTKLGKCFKNYTCKGSESYDLDFDMEMRKIRPDWFVRSSDENKELLRKMAREGQPRPSKKTRIGMCLCRYIKKNDKCYDAEFDAEIRHLAPHWFRKEKKA